MQNQNKNLLIVVAVLIALLIAGVMYLGKIQNETYDQPIAPTSATPGTASSSVSAGATATYTVADVATHNNASSCWTIVNGKVYDVTSFITKHPGGQKSILKMCGTDGTANFTAQHGGKRGPEAALAKQQIGTLK